MDCTSVAAPVSPSIVGSPVGCCSGVTSGSLVGCCSVGCSAFSSCLVSSLIPN